MKKLKLLLATCALLLGAGQTWAQTDVTSTYLTNADFEGTYDKEYTIVESGNNKRYIYKPDGWTVDYKNVSSNNMTVLESTDVMASNFTGVYAVSSDNKRYMVRFRDNQPSEYIDLSQTITVTQKGFYTFSADLIREDGSKINVALYAGENTVSNSTAGTWENRNLTLLLDANTTIKVGIKFTNLGANGVKAGADNVKITFKSIANGDELTSLINNAAVTSTTGWTNGRINSGQQYTGAPDDTYMDTWSATLDQKQTITLPSGYYMLKAATRSSAYASGNIYAYVAKDDVTFRTDIHKEGAAGNLLDGGWAWTRVPVTLTQASAVTIGFWSNCNNSQWAGADNFTLTYYDSELNLAAALFNQVRSDAAAWKTSLEAINTGAKNALSAEDGKSYTSVAEYNEAIARLEAAITFARTTYPTLKAKYDAVKTLVKALPEQTTVYTGSATLSVNEEDVDAQVEAATTEAEMNAAILVWRNAAATFLGAVTVNDNQFFDITNIFLDNADFSAGNILGWETNYVSGQQAQNIGYQGANYTNGDVTISKFIEAWKPQPGTLGDGYLRQTVQNLPEGKYILEADAISVQQSDENIEVAGSFLYIYADGLDYKTTLNTLNNKPQHFSREFLNTGAGDVIFGLKTESSTGNWLCADNFTVKFYGVDLTAYETQLAEAVADAEAVTGIPEGAASVLSTVVTEYNKTYNTSSAYATAISAIQTATATALTFQTPFANYNTAMATANAFDQNNLTSGGWIALQTAISENTVNLANTSITVDALNTATENLNAACTAATAAQAAKVVYDNAVATINGGTNVDLTSLITNPGFETGNTNGWNNDGEITANAQNNSSFDNKQGVYYAERWHVNGTIDINQTVNALPAGIYKIEAYMYSDTEDAKLYVNSESADVTTSQKYFAVVQISDEESIKIGASCTLTTSTWICLDDFKLTYLASDYASLPYELASGKMGTDKASAQTEAETEFTDNPSMSTYEALLDAIAGAEASVANYAKLKTAIDNAEVIIAANNFVTADATTALETEISTATTAWTDVTYTDAQCTSEIATLGSTVSGYKAIASEGKAGAFMASAWGKTSENWWDAPYINTWSTEGDNDGSGFSVPFFEYFTGETANLAANTFTATLKGLENGAYEVELWARVQRRTDANFNGDNSMITMSVNGDEAVSIMNGSTKVNEGKDNEMRLGHFTATGYVFDGTLTLSINVKLGANVHWLSWRDVKYTKLSDAAMMKITDAQWATFCAPFDVAIPNGVKAYTVDGLDNENEGELITTEVKTTIPANKPVLLNSADPVDEIFTGTAEDNTPVTPNAGLLYGVYTATTAPVGSYVLMKDAEEGLGFYVVSDGENEQPTVGANRAYLMVPGASRAAFFFDGKSTGLNDVRAKLSEVSGDVYNLNGQRVTSPRKGLYIMNGKKVVVK